MLVKTAERDRYSFAGIVFQKVSIGLYRDDPDLDCGADYCARDLSLVHNSLWSVARLQKMGNDSCCKGNYLSTEDRCFEVVFCTTSNTTSFISCPSWLERYLPDLFQELFQEEEAPCDLKISFRQPSIPQGPVNFYGLMEGVSSADEALATLSQEIGERFLRDMAILSRTSIEETRSRLNGITILEPVQEIYGRGAGIPWWERKGFASCPD